MYFDTSLLTIYCGATGKALQSKSNRRSLCHEEIEEIRDVVKRAGL